MSEPLHPFSDLLDFLGKTQIFQGLPPEQLAVLVQLARAQSYDKGESIFHQGEGSSGFFIVRSGQIKVFKLSASGREQILHVFSTGDHFAEVPAFDGQCFPASAAALEKTDVLFFPRQLFLELLEKHPALAINMLKSFARHLRRFSNLVDNLSLREVPGRLAAYLLTLCDQTDTLDQIELPLNKGQLAATLGTIPETLSRVFHKLSRDNIIQMEGSRITVLDRERLRRMAE
ncbi:MAG: Crp/Fnr family transcriptional regulator [Leptolyngbya sp. SIO1D8]|nr:Crp/Fnr family transcriptional regulator [Leptolyngbya sp. SIO1D8]